MEPIKFDPQKLEPIKFEPNIFHQKKFELKKIEPNNQGQVEQSSINAIEPTSDLSNCSAPSSGPWIGAAQDARLLYLSLISRMLKI